jgi:hypothetical protein
VIIPPYAPPEQVIAGLRSRKALRRMGAGKLPHFRKKGPGRYRPNIEEMRARHGITP